MVNTTIVTVACSVASYPLPPVAMSAFPPGAFEATLRNIKADMAAGLLSEAQRAAEHASSEFQLVEHQQGLLLLQAELLLLQGALHAAIQSYDDLLASTQKQLPAVLGKRELAKTHTVTLACAEDLTSNISQTLGAGQSPTCCAQVPAAALVSKVACSRSHHVHCVCNSCRHSTLRFS